LTSADAARQLTLRRQAAAQKGVEMYIFARSRSLNPGSFRAGLAAAVEGGSKASALVGQPIFVWTSVLSPTVGTVVWSMRADDLDSLIGVGDTIGADDGFDEWAQGSDALFSGPFTDGVSEVVAGEPTGPPESYLSVVSGTCANGSIAEGMAFGVEIAEMATSITGHRTMFAAAVAGDYGAVTWVTGVPDLNTMADSNRTLSSDPEWLKLVDRAGHAYAQGVTSSILRRLN
jgi:hypothetical protein